MDEKTRKRESEKILRRVARESETIGQSNLARQHKADSDPDEERIDRTGRMIGRGLGYAAVLGLIIYLYLTYFRPD